MFVITNVNVYHFAKVCHGDCKCCQYRCQCLLVRLSIFAIATVNVFHYDYQCLSVSGTVNICSATVNICKCVSQYLSVRLSIFISAIVIFFIATINENQCATSKDEHL